MGELRAVLLDVDGTLIDSNDQHAEAWVETLTGNGFDVTFAQVRSLIGMGADKLLPELTGLSSDSDRGKALTSQRTELFMATYLGRTQPFAGIRELVSRMRADGYTLVVASSANARELEALLERACVHDLLELKTSADDAAHSKPDPDIVRAALHEAGVPAEASLMLGDTPYDVTAARHAGVPIIGLTCGGWKADDLDGALAVFKNPRHLLDCYAQSPLARR
ncbi:MAG TPA: HAD family hydrolase [Polyangiales bacterium]|nr:HAD family hydrolase [Polyangiales bacterium]